MKVRGHVESAHLLVVTSREYASFVSSSSSLGWRCAQEKHVDGHLCLVYVFLRSEQMGREIEQSSHFRRGKRARARQRTPELNQIQDLLTVTSKGICTNRSQIRHGIRPEGPGGFPF